MIKAVIFCRVSSKEQEETGYSLPAQEKLLRSYSDKNNFKVVKTFSISESASGKSQRQTFQNMLRYVQKKE
jgi:site-specific DNA recombinase